MSLLYIYGTGSTTESRRWSLLDDLLNQIPNNNANLVRAKDVRDAVFTLWERLDNLGTSSNLYTNLIPTPVTVGGIAAGSTFSGETIQQMFDKLLYPYQIPTLSLSSLSNKEYGSSASITLSWSVIKKTKNITGIIVDNQSFTPTGNSQNGTKNTMGTYNIPAPASTINTFNMSVTDGTLTNTTSTSFTWMNRIYWGTINLTSIGNPDFGTTPGATSSIVLNSSFILSLSNQLSTTKSKVYSGINGGGNYIIFAWPSSVAGSLSPIFNVNGLQNTAFIRIKTNWSFTNVNGFATPYEVWITNTRQNSPLNISIN